MADASVGTPLQGTCNIARPDVFMLDDLGRITLAARGDHRTVMTDNSAGMLAAATGACPTRAHRDWRLTRPSVQRFRPWAVEAS